MTNTKYKTEKRKARVGERILVTEVSLIKYDYTKDEVFHAIKIMSEGVRNEKGHIILDSEYEVIVGEHTPAPNLDEMSYDELIVLVEDAMKVLRTRSYKLGYDQGRFGTDTCHVTYVKSDQQKRDEIVAQAKEDVEDLVRRHFVSKTDFTVNAAKRTVVALRKSWIDGRILRRGIAKCAPNDCFNVRIGKAIALRRALGLEVPTEYLNVPQPTEIRVDDVIRGRTSFSMDTYEETVRKIAGGKYEYASGGYDYVDEVNLVVIDDSRAGEGE